MVQSTLEAAEKLKADGIDLTVVDVCAIKPCDEDGIVKLLAANDTVFTAEEHSTIGGLGGMIAELASEKCPRPVYRIGLQDVFAESGAAKDLMHKYGLDGEGVAAFIRNRLK